MAAMATTSGGQNAVIAAPNGEQCVLEAAALLADVRKERRFGMNWYIERMAERGG
jgi:hypothetical protein